MRNLIINGGKQLNGTLKIHGAKNSVLPVISASILLSGKSVLHNCPDLTDVTAALEILECLGIKHKRSGSDITVFSDVPESFVIPDNLMRRMRSSVMFLGSILARCGRVTISAPGGCMLGPRPIDIHIAALKKLGAKVRENRGMLEFSAKGGLKGTDIVLDFPSVGATENIIMAAVFAKGKTTVHNAAREPEIKDLIDFLNSAGAKISNGGTDTVDIEGVKELHSTEHTVIPDRIEAATYLTAAAITGGNVKLIDVEPSNLSAVNDVLAKSGCEILCTGNSVTINAPARLKPVKLIKTNVYPGFPTDAGPLIVSALCTAGGTSVFCENIFENRYVFVDELSRFGADINTYGKIAVIEGKKTLLSAHCQCTDLRGGAALVIAALKAEGESTIGNICHIKRGYQDIAENLCRLGADVKEI
ncbi:MAG: UDP-N-acetylglucosamine 1-carboxyvinyltransferase [Clostridia bacterium]|nr:UDP-N-acetylglucosamine 1-carboxyvinyltransferase [Clostridia bacterium]